MTLKLLKKGIRINGEYFPCWYSSHKNNIKSNATIYIKTYKDLPKEAYATLAVENHTELATDYFDFDKIGISKDNPLFDRVEELAKRPFQPFTNRRI